MYRTHKLGAGRTTEAHDGLQNPVSSVPSPDREMPCPQNVFLMYCSPHTLIATRKISFHVLSAQVTHGRAGFVFREIGSAHWVIGCATAIAIVGAGKSVHAAQY